jgi:wobble nucleotide-excising tRNase
VFIKKIIKIARLGRFRTSNIRGGEYAKFTLIYGGNGRGKTTLCSVLRSFQLNESRHILERTSFGAKSTPEVQLLLDSGTATFSDGKWSKTSSELRIFDAQFVSDNVHDGENVETEHRRNY